MAKMFDMMSDLEKETKGVWKICPMNGLRCLIARRGNSKFKEAKDRLKRDRNIKLSVDPESTEDDAKRLLVHIVAEFILLDWKDLVGLDDEPMPYSRENAEKLLRIPELHDFYDWVLQEAADMSNFKKEAEEEDKGN